MVTELDQALVKSLVAAWKADRAPADIIAATYGNFAGLAKMADSPTLKDTYDFPATIGKVQKALGYDLTACPTAHKVMTDASDVATGGVPKAAKRVQLTPELRATFRKYCLSVAEGCRLAL